VSSLDDGASGHFQSLRQLRLIQASWAERGDVAPRLHVPGTDAFDDTQYIETEGRLVSEQSIGGKSVLLKLDEGSQTFVAIAEYSSLGETLNPLKNGSRLRLRGICVTDRAFAQDVIPFAKIDGQLKTSADYNERADAIRSAVLHSCGIPPSITSPIAIGAQQSSCLLANSFADANWSDTCPGSTSFR
jgi:hypothetical protein